MRLPEYPAARVLQMLRAELSEICADAGTDAIWIDERTQCRYHPMPKTLPPMIAALIGGSHGS